MPFQCSICGEESTRICARCTKDACDNHLCDKCRKCSDCCECEVALSPHAPETVREAMHPEVMAMVPVEPILDAPVDFDPEPVPENSEPAATAVSEVEPEPPTEPDAIKEPEPLVEPAPEREPEPPAAPEAIHEPEPPADAAPEAPGSNMLP